MLKCRNCGKTVHPDHVYTTEAFTVYVHAEDEMYSCHGAFHPMNLTYAEIEGQPQYSINVDGKVILK